MGLRHVNTLVAQMMYIPSYGCIEDTSLQNWGVFSNFQTDAINEFPTMHRTNRWFDPLSPSDMQSCLRHSTRRQ